MLLCDVQEPWTIQELVDCVDGSIAGCNFDQVLILSYSSLWKNQCSIIRSVV